MYAIDRYCLALESIATDCDKITADYQMSRIMGGPAMEADEANGGRLRQIWERIKELAGKIWNWIKNLPKTIAEKITNFTNFVKGLGNKDGNNTGTAVEAPAEAVNDFQEAVQDVEKKAKASQSVLQKAGETLQKFNSGARVYVEDALKDFDAFMRSDAVLVLGTKPKGGTESFTAMEAEGTKKVDRNWIMGQLTRIGGAIRSGVEAATNGVRNCTNLINKASTEPAGEATAEKQKLISRVLNAYSNISKSFTESWQRLFSSARNLLSSHKKSGSNDSVAAATTDAVRTTAAATTRTISTAQDLQQKSAERQKKLRESSKRLSRLKF